MGTELSPKPDPSQGSNWDASPIRMVFCPTHTRPTQVARVGARVTSMVNVPGSASTSLITKLCIKLLSNSRNEFCLSRTMINSNTL